ncbi:MAG: prepilin-type N-terminal cleavage/methylation domain-containing protein [Patescibacteria group bacterium]
MRLYNLQKNKESVRIAKQGGFTLIETMIAVFILAAAITTLIGLISTSLFSSRYAKNDIIANYLIQEAIDYARNDRDTTAYQHNLSGTWASFLGHYGYPSSMCFAGNGCKFEPSAQGSSTIDAISVCSGTLTWGSVGCEILNYDQNAANKDFYTYATPSGYTVSNFKRKVVMTVTPINGQATDQLNISVTVEWLNGNLPKSRVFRTSLLNWKQ